MEKTKVSYRVIRFPNDRFVCLAWNYAKAVVFATKDFNTYTEARAALDQMALDRGVLLQYFAGEDELAADGETLVPVSY